MWQEFIQLRETYLQQPFIKNEIYQEHLQNQFLYEIMKLSGNALPETAFYNILRTNKRPHHVTALKAYDLWQAWKYIREAAEKKLPFTIDLVQKIAAKVMKHTGKETTTTVGRYDTSLGDFRLGEDYNAIYSIAEYAQIPELLTALCRKVNARLPEAGVEQLIKTATDYLFEFAHIKPFGEGNIETGLLSTNYLLLYHHQPLLFLYGEDRAEVLSAVKTQDISHTPETFEKFILYEQIKFFKNQMPVQ